MFSKMPPLSPVFNAQLVLGATTRSHHDDAKRQSFCVRRLLALLPISLSSMTANSKSQGIYLCRFNPRHTQTGLLSPVELAAESIDPGCISFAPSDP
jgi:hypothetical protein